MELDLKQPLPMPASYYYTSQDSDFDDTSYIFNIESQHMPSNFQDIDIFFRQKTISVISILSSNNNVDRSLFSETEMLQHSIIDIRT